MQAPYAIPISRPVSHSNLNGKWFFLAKAALEATSSKLTPRTTMPELSKALYWSRNPQPSRVQPPVSALG